jgi:hypothetical protein
MLAILSTHPALNACPPSPQYHRANTHTHAHTHTHTHTHTPSHTHTLQDEILIPALSYLEITGDSYVIKTSGGNVTVFPASINCNLKAQTIQEIQARRKQDVKSLLPYLTMERKRDCPTVVSALSEDGLLANDEATQALETQREEVEGKFASMEADLKQHLPAWFNNDQNYVMALSDAIGFKGSSLASLAASACGHAKYHPTSSPVSHFCAEKGHAKVLAALLSVGAAAVDEQDKVTSLLPLLLIARLLAAPPTSLSICQSIHLCGAAPPICIHLHTHIYVYIYLCMY